MQTKLFKVWADNDLVRNTFMEADEAIAWAEKNHTNFNLFRMELSNGRIETSLDGCDFGIHISQAEENNDHLVYLHDELLGRFPEKKRRATVKCVINKMLSILQEEEERYDQWDEFDAARGEEEGPYGGAFRDQEDYENWRFGGISYLNSI